MLRFLCAAAILVGAGSGGGPPPQDLPAASSLTPAEATWRSFELDLECAELPDGALQTLPRELRECGFDSVVVWLPPSVAERLPPERRELLEFREPLAGEFLPDETWSPPLDSALRFAQAGLRVAIGVRTDEQPATTPVAPLFVRDRAGAIQVLRRIARPAATTLPWCDPDFGLQRISPVRSVVASARQLLALPIERRREQLALDLEAFAVRPGAAPSDTSLAPRSRLFTTLSDRIAGAAAGSFDPASNRCNGPAAGTPPPLRREPAWLDLEEWLFSVDLAGRSLIDALADEAPPPSPFDPRDGTTPWSALFDARWQAAWYYGRTLASDPALKVIKDDPVAACRAALDRQEALLAELPEIAAIWREGLAEDRTRLAAAADSPWRMHGAPWQVTLRGAGGSFTLARRWTCSTVDDPRVGAWSGRIDDVLGSIDVAPWLGESRDAHATLRLELPLRDPRSGRLHLAVDGTVTVKVNAQPLLEQYDAARASLVTTLPLAAGTNVVTIDVDFAGTQRRLQPRFLLQPNRYEGATFLPRDAKRVREPIVRLRDPTALDEESLVWPEGRNPTRDDRGVADFTWNTVTAGRFDLWLHALAANRPGQGDARIAVNFDDRVAQELVVPAGPGWTWMRLPAPCTLEPGDHLLQLTLGTPGVRVDNISLLPSELAIPRPPDNRVALSDSLWRFDPLGTGLVIDLPSLATAEFFGRVFTVPHGATYAVYAWLRGRDPLVPGDWAQVDVESTTVHQRFVLPAGVPLEEWVALGTLTFNEQEKVEFRARGRGSVARIALTR